MPTHCKLLNPTNQFSSDAFVLAVHVCRCLPMCMHVLQILFRYTSSEDHGAGDQRGDHRSSGHGFRTWFSAHSDNHRPGDQGGPHILGQLIWDRILCWLGRPQSGDRSPGHGFVTWFSVHSGCMQECVCIFVGGPLAITKASNCIILLSYGCRSVFTVKLQLCFAKHHEEEGVGPGRHC